MILINQGSFFQKKYFLQPSRFQFPEMNKLLQNTLNQQTLHLHLFIEIFIQKMLAIIKIFKPFTFETCISC